MNSSVMKRWQKGRDNFERFWKQIAKKDQWFPSDISQLQMLFLGEKPACFRNAIATQYKNILTKMGYVCRKDWIYDPLQIQKIHKRYKRYYPTSLLPGAPKANEAQIGLFLGFPLHASKEYARYEEILLPRDAKRKRSIRTIMESSKDAPMAKIMQQLLKMHTEIGLDAKSVRWIRSKGVHPLYISVYGMTWMDFGTQTRDSQKHYLTLKRAYEQSGMKDIIAPIIQKNPDVFRCAVTKK